MWQHWFSGEEWEYVTEYTCGFIGNSVQVMGEEMFESSTRPTKRMAKAQGCTGFE